MIKNLPTKYSPYYILFSSHSGNLFASFELSIVNELALVPLTKPSLHSYFTAHL